MAQRKDFHTFSKNGRFFLFLTQPVAVFKVDEDTHRILSLVEGGEVLTSPFEERRWKEASTFMEDYCAKAPPVRTLRAPADITDKVTGLYLFLSQECNLKCAYCYGGEGEYGRPGKMSEQTLENTFATFFSGGKGKHLVTFFGGEPLMNFPLMERTAELSGSYRHEGKADISLGIVTNGTLYNGKIAEFFRQHLVDVTFSLDGPPDLNDSQRISKSGRSVYKQAEKNIRKLTRNAPFNWAFRTIVTRRGHDRIAEIYRHLDSFGPGGIGVVNVDAPKDSPLYLDDEQYRKFVRQIVEINREGLDSFLDGGQPVAFEYPFYILFYFISRSHALYHCNAGTNLLAVDAEGDVYPCHRFVGDEAFRLGNVADPAISQSPQYKVIREKFIGSTVDNRQGCKECWARYLCGGSCAKYSFAEHGDIDPPVARYCGYIKTIIEELLPDIVAAIEKPGTREKLVTRLRAAVTHRHGNRSLEESRVP